MEFNAERGASSTDAEEGTSATSTVKADDPSLADMTRATLSILTKNDKGFFLLIEGLQNTPFYPFILLLLWFSGSDKFYFISTLTPTSILRHLLQFNIFQ